MSAYDDRVKQLAELAQVARDAVATIPKEARSGYEPAFLRLNEVLAYAALVLASTGGRLVSDNAFNEISNALGVVRDRLPSEPQQADAFASPILDALARLPATRGQELADEAKSAAASFQRSAAQRQNALIRKSNEASLRLDEVAGQIEQHRIELVQSLEERKAEAEQQVGEVREALDAERQRIEATTTEQAETFRTAQDERAAAFNASLEEFGTEQQRVVDATTDAAQKHVAEIKRMEEESAALVGAIGVHGSAGRYADEVTEQRKTANTWRWITVAVVAAAVAAAIFASRADDISDPAFVSKALISLALGGLAAYTAKQSARHRRREESARQTQLDLSAFGPFIEPLPDDKQAIERAELGRRIFGRRLLPEEAENGPGVVQQIRRGGGDGLPVDP